MTSQGETGKACMHMDPADAPTCSSNTTVMQLKHSSSVLKAREMMHNKPECASNVLRRSAVCCCPQTEQQLLTF
jgi:hypothetical protein